MRTLRTILTILRPRYSLRALMILTACIAAFCWWREQPRQAAERFVKLVGAGRYVDADRMFVEQRHRFVAEFMRDERNTIQVARDRQTVLDWLLGERRVLVQLEDFRGLGASIATHVTATSSGMGATTLVESRDGVEFSPAPEMSLRLEEQFMPHIKLDDRPDTDLDFHR